MVGSNDIHTVQIRSQTRNLASVEATQAVSKPYATQIQESLVNRQSTCSSNTPTLKGVQLALPLDSIASNFPDVCRSLRAILNSDNEQDIHLIKSNSDSYTNCTYTDICVNKIQVKAIFDSGAPFNIVSTKLVKRLGIAPDIDHKQEYGTAGSHTTTSLGA